jgi:hypothetical protein
MAYETFNPPTLGRSLDPGHRHAQHKGPIALPGSGLLAREVLFQLVERHLDDTFLPDHDLPETRPPY